MGADDSLEAASEGPNKYYLNRLDLQERMTKLLPLMARICLNENNRDEDSSGGNVNVIPLLHAACIVSCPLAMIGIALKARPDSIKIKHEPSGRLPLHYAASRGGYHRTFAAGVTGKPVEINEVSPIFFVLSKFPKACCVADASGQLPLHIAIDHIKEKRHKEREKISNYVQHTELNMMLDQYPEALHRRDGLTKLYPYQQAAEGEHGNIELTFSLLRRDPILICPGSSLDR
ncbi:MAG: hypothetical protein SGILL_007434 [Bacillariaceae sp.]